MNKVIIRNPEDMSDGIVFRNDKVVNLPEANTLVHGIIISQSVKDLIKLELSRDDSSIDYMDIHIRKTIAGLGLMCKLANYRVVATIDIEEWFGAYKYAITRNGQLISQGFARKLEEIQGAILPIFKTISIELARTNLHKSSNGEV